MGQEGVLVGGWLWVGDGGCVCGGGGGNPLLPQNRGDADVEGGNREEGNAEKRTLFQRLSLPEITHLRPAMCVCVCVRANVCVFMHIRV